MSETEEYREGYKAGYASGFSDGTGAGYNDAKHRTYLALEAAKDGNENHKQGIKVAEQAITQILGKRV